MKRIAAISASIFLLTGCNVYIGPDIRLKRPVSAEEVTGIWVLRSDSLVVAKKDGFHPYHEQPGSVHEIEFRSNGTCHFRSVLQMPTRYMDCEGTWRLEHNLEDKKVPELSLHLKWNGGHGGLYFSLDFTEEHGHLVLWEYWGDPDTREFLKYDKQPKGGANGRQPVGSETNRTSAAAAPRRSP